MLKCMKKPIVIECLEINEDNMDELRDLSVTVNESIRLILNDKTGLLTGLSVITERDNMQGTIGDFLLKGVKGEYYICPRDVFLESYGLYEG